MNPEQVKTFLEAFDEWAYEQDQVGCYYDVDDKLGCAFHIWKSINIPFEEATKLYRSLTGKYVFQAMVTKVNPKATPNFPYTYEIVAGVTFILLSAANCRELSNNEIQFYIALLEYDLVNLFEQAKGKEEDSDEYQELVSRVYEFERDWYQEID